MQLFLLISDTPLTLEGLYFQVSSSDHRVLPWCIPGGCMRALCNDQSYVQICQMETDAVTDFALNSEKNSFSNILAGKQISMWIKVPVLIKLTFAPC